LTPQVVRALDESDQGALDATGEDLRFERNGDQRALAEVLGLVSGHVTSERKL